MKRVLFCALALVFLLSGTAFAKLTELPMDFRGEELPAAVQQSAYSVNLHQYVRNAKYNGDGYFGGTLEFVAAAGSLPRGLSLSKSGILSGIPLEHGVYHFDISVNNFYTAVTEVAPQQTEDETGGSAASDAKADPDLTQKLEAKTVTFTLIVHAKGYTPTSPWDNFITGAQLQIDGKNYPGALSGNTIYFTVPEGVSLKKAYPILMKSPRSTSTPAPGVAMDLSAPQYVTVTSENGLTNTYLLSAVTAGKPAESSTVKVKTGMECTLYRSPGGIAEGKVPAGTLLRVLRLELGGQWLSVELEDGTRYSIIANAVSHIKFADVEGKALTSATLYTDALLKNRDKSATLSKGERVTVYARRGYVYYIGTEKGMRYVAASAIELGNLDFEK